MFGWLLKLIKTFGTRINGPRRKSKPLSFLNKTERTCRGENNIIPYLSNFLQVSLSVTKSAIFVACLLISWHNLFEDTKL